jgi:hypothetical protein
MVQRARHASSSLTQQGRVRPLTTSLASRTVPPPRLPVLDKKRYLADCGVFHLVPVLLVLLVLGQERLVDGLER